MAKSFREEAGEIIKEIKEIIEGLSMNDTKALDNRTNEIIKELLERFFDRILDLINKDKWEKAKKGYDKKTQTFEIHVGPKDDVTISANLKKLLKKVKNKNRKKLEKLFKELKKLKEKKKGREKAKKELEKRQSKILENLLKLLGYIKFMSNSGNGTLTLNGKKIENLKTGDTISDNITTARKFIKETVEEAIKSIKEGKIVEADIALRILKEYIEKEIKDRSKRDAIIDWIDKVEDSKVVEFMPVQKDTKIEISKKITDKLFINANPNIRINEHQLSDIYGISKETAAAFSKNLNVKTIEEFSTNLLVNKATLINKISNVADNVVDIADLNEIEVKILFSLLEEEKKVSEDTKEQI